MSFTVESLEFYLLIIMRISSFVLTAPLFSHRSIPARVKIAISVWLSVVVISATPEISLEYTGVVGYAVLVIQESIVGMILGFMCNLCLYIIHFAGQIIDMEIGLSMANMFDPASGIQVTVTGNLYNYLVMLLLVVTNMYHYVIRGIMDSFSYFNVGQAVFRLGLKDIAVDFMANYFLIALRIVLPVLCCILIMDVVLGVLTKAAPQMNMFAVGIQLKVLIGIILLILLVETIPTVAQFIFDEMKTVITQVIYMLKP